MLSKITAKRILNVIFYYENFMIKKCICKSHNKGCLVRGHRGTTKT